MTILQNLDKSQQKLLQLCLKNSDDEEALLNICSRMMPASKEANLLFFQQLKSKNDNQDVLDMNVILKSFFEAKQGFIKTQSKQKRKNFLFEMTFLFKLWAPVLSWESAFQLATWTITGPIHLSQDLIINQLTDLFDFQQNYPALLSFIAEHIISRGFDNNADEVIQRNWDKKYPHIELIEKTLDKLRQLKGYEYFVRDISFYADRRSLINLLFWLENQNQFYMFLCAFMFHGLAFYNLNATEAVEHYLSIYNTIKDLYVQDFLLHVKINDNSTTTKLSKKNIVKLRDEIKKKFFTFRDNSIDAENYRLNQFGLLNAIHTFCAEATITQIEAALLSINNQPIVSDSIITIQPVQEINAINSKSPCFSRSMQFNTFAPPIKPTIKVIEDTYPHLYNLYKLYLSKKDPNFIIEDHFPQEAIINLKDAKDDFTFITKIEKLCQTLSVLFFDWEKRIITDAEATDSSLNIDKDERSLIKNLLSLQEAHVRLLELQQNGSCSRPDSPIEKDRALITAKLQLGLSVENLSKIFIYMVSPDKPYVDIFWLIIHLVSQAEKIAQATIAEEKYAALKAKCATSLIAQEKANLSTATQTVANSEYTEVDTIEPDEINSNLIKFNEPNKAHKIIRFDLYSAMLNTFLATIDVKLMNNDLHITDPKELYMLLQEQTKNFLYNKEDIGLGLLLNNILEHVLTKKIDLNLILNAADISFAEIVSTNKIIN